MPLMTPAEVAAELRISAKHLHRLTQAGEIPYVNVGRGLEREARRYDRADVEAFVRKNKVRVDPDAHLRSKRHRASSSTQEVYDFEKLRAEIRRDEAAKRASKQ